MRPSRVRGAAWLVAAVLLAAGCTESLAQEKDDPFGASSVRTARQAEGHLAARPAADDRQAEHRIRSALQSATVMEFIETPLQDAVDYLKDLHGIEIQIDHRALEESGMGSDTPVTRTLKGMSLAAALELLLSNHDLTYVVRHGVLQISTPGAIANMMELRVYDVHDLLTEGDVEELTRIVELALDSPAPAKVAVTGGVAPAVAQVAAYPPQDNSPAHLANDGGSVVMPYGNFIVVRASVLEHEAIGDLLNDMRVALAKAAR